MKGIYDFFLAVCNVFARFVPKVVALFSSSVDGLVDLWPTWLQVIIAPSLKFLEGFGLANVTLLELCFGVGFVFWVGWCIIKFFLSTT